MTRDRRRTLLPLALAGVIAAGCGDDGTNPPSLGDFEPGAVTAAVIDILAPVDAALEPNFVFSTFASAMLDGAATAAPRSFDRLAGPAGAGLGAEALRASGAGPLQTRAADIPQEMHGRTFIWDPGTETWVEDPERTGAPPQGVRVIWYAIDNFGDFVLPLQEVGTIDITEDDSATLDRLAVLIIRTDGAEDMTVADYVYGQGVSESGDTWNEVIELVGVFGQGADAVDVEINGEDTGSFTTGNEDYAFEIRVDGPEGSYRWSLEGSLDGATGTSDDAYAATVTANGATTILGLDTDADAEGTMNGTGTLSHAGTRVADIAVSDSEFSYSPPGGGSFTPAQLADLDELTFYMLYSGPLLLFVLPFVEA